MRKKYKTPSTRIIVAETAEMIATSTPSTSGLHISDQDKGRQIYDDDDGNWAKFNSLIDDIVSNLPKF